MGEPIELIGTSAFGPNLNMIRDPRYGRNSELPSEDPFLTAGEKVDDVLIRMSEIRMSER